MKLYDYWRSSTAYRVRIALNLKGLPYDVASVSLVAGGGENLSEAYLAVNPQGRVPTLQLGGGAMLIQSMAILEYLEEAHRTPALLPKDLLLRSKVRAICGVIACDIHPLNNVRTLRSLRTMGADELKVENWYARWITEGFEVIEQMVDASPYSVGDAPGMADICLIPQMYNARRFSVPLRAFPKLQAIEARCLEIDAFHRARPEAQPDAI